MRDRMGRNAVSRLNDPANSFKTDWNFKVACNDEIRRLDSVL